MVGAGVSLRSRASEDREISSAYVAAAAVVVADGARVPAVFSCRMDDRVGADGRSGHRSGADRPRHFVFALELLEFSEAFASFVDFAGRAPHGGHAPSLRMGRVL